ncbi:MAG: PEP/pyruvate-binding domain-containing protein, partial [Patescibacteria group bacterium]
MKSEYIRQFNEIRKEDVAVVGGKGASLGEMTAAGIPVPPGFVVCTSAFESFIHEAQLKAEIESILKTVDHAVMHTIEGASEQIQGIILMAPLPQVLADAILCAFDDLGAEAVAVRSSATAEDSASAAWA